MQNHKKPQIFSQQLPNQRDALHINKQINKPIPTVNGLFIGLFKQKHSVYFHAQCAQYSACVQCGRANRPPVKKLTANCFRRTHFSVCKIDLDLID